MKKRNGAGIWKNMYDFPLIEQSDYKLPEISAIEEILNCTVSELKVQHRMTHLLTHRQLDISFYHVKCDLNKINLPKGSRYVSFNDIDQIPLPRPIEIFLSLYPDELLFF
jgi:A/G-specific adenine glycosylase